MRRLLQLTGLSLLLTGCALLYPPPAPPRVVPTVTSERTEERVTVLDEPYDTLTLTRVRGALRVHVETQPTCRVQVYRALDQGYSNGRVERGTFTLGSERRTPCRRAQPAVGLDVGLQTGPRLQVLGTTSQTGLLEVPYDDLDARFAGQAVALSQQAQLLIHGKLVAELPLGLIVNRMRLSADVLAGADATLADPSADREKLQARLTELWTLQMQGVDDPRLNERALRVYIRLKTYVDPQLQPTAAAQATPAAQPTAAPVPPDAELHAGDLRRAESLLPDLCRATVAGGETVLGALALTGTAGILLAFMHNLLDVGYNQSLAHECCIWAMSMLMHANNPRCDTDIELAERETPRQSDADTIPQPQAMRP
jgi:hypothetical protein